MKKTSFFDTSYWCDYYGLGEQEFWSMVISNNIDIKKIERGMIKCQT